MHLQNKYTALTRAAEQGRTDCVRLLMDAGAHIAAADIVRFFLRLCPVWIVFSFYWSHSVV
jgi:ankyrin repeat protein